MQILQIGMWKSGNFWVYNILQNVLNKAGIAQTGYMRNQPIYPLAQTWTLTFEEQAGLDHIDILRNGTFAIIGSQYRELIEDFDVYLSQTTHVWSESYFCSRTPEALSKFDKVVYIVRDPRDRAISMSRFAFKPYMKKHFPNTFGSPEEYLDKKLGRMVRNWTMHVGGYLAHMDDLNVHVVFYERLLKSFDTEFRDLLTYLEIDLSDDDIEAIRHAVDFSTMKQKNPNHLRQGKAGASTQVLRDEQLQTVTNIAGPMMDLLNYGVAAPKDDLPQLPSTLHAAQVREAMRRRSKRHSQARRGVRKILRILDQ